MIGLDITDEVVLLIGFGAGVVFICSWMGIEFIFIEAGRPELIELSVVVLLYIIVSDIEVGYSE